MAASSSQVYMLPHSSPEETESISLLDKLKSHFHPCSQGMGMGWLAWPRLAVFKLAMHILEGEWSLPKGYTGLDSFKGISFHIFTFCVHSCLKLISLRTPLQGGTIPRSQLPFCCSANEEDFPYPDRTDYSDSALTSDIAVSGHTQKGQFGKVASEQASFNQGFKTFPVFCRYLLRVKHDLESK